jgi:hypothetical protein
LSAFIGSGVDVVAERFRPDSSRYSSWLRAATLVRRQIGVLAELLGTDLNQARTLAELWIALQYMDELVARPDAADPGAVQLPHER